MIIGIGVDLVKISRIERAGNGHPGFLERVFTQKERDYCEPPEVSRAALRGAVRVQGGGPEGLRHGHELGHEVDDIEVLHGEGGGPIVNLTGTARDLADLRGIRQVLLSYSHDEGYAVAQAVLIGRGAVRDHG